MNFFLKLFKFIIILAILIVIALYYFFDDLKRFALKRAIDTLTENGKYLTENYSIKEKEGITYLSNLKIKRPDYSLTVKQISVDFPHLFLLGSPINIELDAFNFKLLQGPNISVTGSTKLDCWYKGKLNVDTKGIDLAYNGEKVLKIAGNFDSNKKLNELDLYDYLDKNSKGKIIFGITNFTQIHFESIQLPYARGMVTAKPFDIDANNPKLTRLDLDVNKVQLGSLIKLDLLNVDARFSGSLSVNPDQKTITYINLKSTEPGKLKFKTGGIGDVVEKIQDSPLGKILNMTGNNPLAKVEKAMNIFEYSSIHIETQKSSNATDNVKISIYGADQKLYDGKPMNLNINLDIDLNGIINNYLRSVKK